MPPVTALENSLRDDLERWDRKYLARLGAPPMEPEPLLARYQHLLPEGDALDVACGEGQNALWLARRGHRVLGVDGSSVGLREAAAAARRAALPVVWLCVDLDGWVPPKHRFDLVVVVRYLNRPLVPHLLAALRPGGVIFYRTFNVNRAAEDDRFPSDYLLKRGELRRLLSSARILAGNDAEDVADTSSWLIARMGDA